MSRTAATANDTNARLEYLRGELRAERISYGELAELQSLAGQIDAGDVELLEAAGVPEFDREQEEQNSYDYRNEQERERFDTPTVETEATATPTFFPQTLTLQPCNCGASTCDRVAFREGMFYQGSGFPRELAEEVKRRYDTYQPDRERRLVEALRGARKWAVAATWDKQFNKEAQSTVNRIDAALALVDNEKE